MKTATVTFTGVSTLSQGKHYSKDEVPEKESETHAAYERRTWRHRMHVKEGFVYLPPMGFQRCLLASAQRLGLKVPGKGQQKYTKSFEAGVMVTEPVVLDVRAEDVPPEALFVPSDGVRGSGKRVTKLFPQIEKWGGTVKFFILDALITEDVFRRVLENAGALVGLGRFRPERGGYYGRFEVTDLKWSDDGA